jgi:predicted dehydrogenase
VNENIKTNIWFFGAGYWAQVLVKKINKKFPNHIIQVIDPNIKASMEFASKYLFVVPSSVKIFKEKAKNGDFGFVVTPPNTHYQIASDLLDLGCHTWVEKPLTTNAIQAEELIKKATAQNLTLFIDNTFLFDPLILSLKKLNQTDNKINHIHSRRQGWGKVLKDLGVLWDLLPHDLSIVNNIFGKIQNHSLLSINFGPEKSKLNRTSLAASIMLTTVDNITIQIDLSAISRNKIRQIQLMNSNELITYDLNSYGSAIFKSNWDSLPGLISTDTELMTENILNTEDSLSNALDCFIGLAEKGILHESMDFAVHEIRIIQDLFDKSQLILDLK